MNTLHLKYAVEVEKTRSISQAAENLYMAQPNLSKAIKELEDSLGITIFERSARGVIPTKKGIEFLAYAKDILRQVEKMETLSTPENSDRQAFRISIPRGSYIARAFTNFVAELDAQKEIDVSVQETNSMQTIANVVDHKHGLGIIRYPADYENYFLDYLKEKKLSYEPIWEFDYLAVMSKAHPMANVTEVQYAKLSKYVEITHGDNKVPYLTARMAAKASSPSKTKRKIYVYERCSQFDMLSNIPSTYMWVSPIPEEILTLYNLVQRKCSGAYHTYKDVLVYEEGYRLTQLDERFLKKLYESKDKVSSKIYT